MVSGGLALILQQGQFEAGAGWIPVFVNLRLYLELTCLKTTPFSRPAGSGFVGIGTWFCFVFFGFQIRTL